MVSIETLFGWLMDAANVCRPPKPDDAALKGYANKLARSGYQPDRIRRALEFWPEANHYWPDWLDLREAIEREPAETPPAGFERWRISQAGKTTLGFNGETPVPLTIAEFHRQTLERIAAKRASEGTLTADEIMMLTRYDRIRYERTQEVDDLRLELNGRGLLQRYGDPHFWVQVVMDKHRLPKAVDGDA